MKKFVAFSIIGSMLSGCVTKVPLNDNLLPTVTSGKAGVSIIGQYVMYEYDVKNNSMNITDISLKQPHDDSLHAMYTYNWNMHKRDSKAIISDCIYVKSSGVFEKCNTGYGGTFWELSVYHDSLYSTAFTIGWISPIPLVWPVLAIVMPNIAARGISNERVKTVGSVIYKGAQNAY